MTSWTMMTMRTSYLIRVPNESLAVTRVALEQLEGIIEYEYPGATFTDFLVLLTIESLDQLVSAIFSITVLQGL
jgi:division protein CdvB (Snf7/Vps24/ESCRT-III family)